MKKLIFIVLIMLLVIFVYQGFNEENTIDEDEYLILEYHSYPVNGSSEGLDNYPYVMIYNDRKIEWGYGDGENKNFDTITEKQYNRIISLAFSEEFTSLDEDISGEDDEDGQKSYITIYYENGDMKRIGGLNPDKEIYLIIESELEKIYNKDH